MAPRELKKSPRKDISRARIEYVHSFARNDDDVAVIVVMNRFHTHVIITTTTTTSLGMIF